MLSVTKGKQCGLAVTHVVMVLWIVSSVVEQPVLAAPSQTRASLEKDAVLATPSQAPSPLEDTAKSLPKNMLKRPRRESNLYKDATSVQYNSTTLDCSVEAVEPNIVGVIHKLVTEDNVKLILYSLSLANYTYDPLMSNMTVVYRGNSWARTTTTHGQTLLSLAFNYGALSMNTLTFGVESINVSLADSPYGCFGLLSEKPKIELILELLMKDFQSGQELRLTDDESICHQVVQASGSYVFFTYRCCKVSVDGVTIHCYIHDRNMWLQIIQISLLCVKIFGFFFGAKIAQGILAKSHLDSIPYVVKLKEPLIKVICITYGKDEGTIKATRTLDLREINHFKKFGESLRTCKYTEGQPLSIKIWRYEIAVDYGRLLVENKIPLGLLRSLSNAVFLCGFKDIAVCKPCCDAPLFPCFLQDKIKWITFWKPIGYFLMLLCIPFIFYLRLVVFYMFEKQEILYRQMVAARNNLQMPTKFNLVYYVLPTHPACITLYVLCIITLIVVGSLAITGDQKKFERIVFTSFADLDRVSLIKVFEVIVRKYITPFRKLGLAGCIVAPICWLFLTVVYLPVYIFVCLPLTHVTFRIIQHSFEVLRRPSTATGDEKCPTPRRKSLTQLKIRQKTVDQRFLLNELTVTKEAMHSRMLVSGEKAMKGNPLRVCFRVLAIVLLLVTLYGVSLLTAECIGFIAEIITFTLMGIIVNAGVYLKYVSFIFMVFMYSSNCYSDVYKKYLRLNKALFTEVKGRVSDDVDEVSRQTSDLQENTAFQACMNSQQAAHETPDDVSKRKGLFWDLNDIILFIDKYDMPRLPKLLFDRACQVQVAGSPGPVYLSMLAATKQFICMVLFLIFIVMVVLSFGSIYQISSTNQMLATIAGGVLPLLMRMFLNPSGPSIELGSVSFRTKLEEVIDNFRDEWPMCDFPFEPHEPEVSAEGTSRDSSSCGSPETQEDNLNGEDNGRDVSDGTSIKEHLPDGVDIHIIMLKPKVWRQSTTKFTVSLFRKDKENCMTPIMCFLCSR